MAPVVRITELLAEVDRWTGFGAAFTHLHTGLPAGDTRIVLTAVLADATNLGLSRMADACTLATYRQLVWASGWVCMRPRPPAELERNWYCCGMAVDMDKIDDPVLALLFLTLHDHWRAWKVFDWDALNRLYEKGLIGDPVNKAKSVVFTEEGLKRAEELFRAMFTKPD